MYSKLRDVLPLLLPLVAGSAFADEEGRVPENHGSAQLAFSQSVGQGNFRAPERESTYFHDRLARNVIESFIKIDPDYLKTINPEDIGLQSLPDDFEERKKLAVEYMNTFFAGVLPSDSDAYAEAQFLARHAAPLVAEMREIGEHYEFGYLELNKEKHDQFKDLALKIYENPYSKNFRSAAAVGIRKTLSDKLAPQRMKVFSDIFDGSPAEDEAHTHLIAATVALGLYGFEDGQGLFLHNTEEAVGIYVNVLDEVCVPEHGAECSEVFPD